MVLFSALVWRTLGVGEKNEIHVVQDNIIEVSAQFINCWVVYNHGIYQTMVLNAVPPPFKPTSFSVKNAFKRGGSESLQNKSYIFFCK